MCKYNQLGKTTKNAKKAIRIICNANYRAHTTPLFKEQKILPPDKLIEFSRIKFMHNFHFKQLPISFAETWKTRIIRIRRIRIRTFISDQCT